jgi:lipoate-protein ligase A
MGSEPHDRQLTARPTERWRLLPFSLAPSARHVALADALVRVGQEPTVWWHAADAPTLLLGAGQSEPGFAPETLRVTRRRSGGTAVLATPSVLGLDVLLPRGHPLALPDVVEAYRWLGQIWSESMCRLGLDARVVEIAEARTAAPPPADLAEAVRLACFGTLSPYEVVVGQHKLVGLAQIRRRNVLLQSGLHFTFDARELAHQLAPDRTDALAEELQRRATGLAELGLPDVGVDQLTGTFASVLAERQGVRLSPGEWTKEELGHAEAAG